MGDLSFNYLGTQVAFPSPVGFKPWIQAIGRPLGPEVDVDHSSTGNK
jgi:hypothetical protein